MKKTVPYSKVWELLRCEMNNPSLMPTRSQEVSSLLYNGNRSCRKVVKKLNHYCKENGIKTKFSHNKGMTIGELFDQAEPLDIDVIMSRRMRNLKKKNKYVY